jgi:hypothetical protein
MSLLRGQTIQLAEEKYGNFGQEVSNFTNIPVLFLLNPQVLIGVHVGFVSPTKVTI